jgi:hypothetical protein
MVGILHGLGGRMGIMGGMGRKRKMLLSSRFETRSNPFRVEEEKGYVLSPG